MFSRVRYFASLTSFLVVASQLHAIVNIGDPLGTASAPTGTGGQPDDPGFYSVGRVTNDVLGSTPIGSGVYLGNGWVLTADHVNGRTFITQSGIYSWDGVNSQQIGSTDLRIFKLSSIPTESPISIASSRPVDGTFTVMVGAGRSPEASLTTWHVNTGTWTWSETSFVGANATLDGYKTQNPAVSTRVPRWGTNEIISTGTSTYMGANTLETEFNLSGTTYEGQGVQNDSGGAFFVETTPGNWQLAGLIVTVSLYPNQPDGNQTAIDGNRTVAIDLSAYEAEIMAVVPETAHFGVLLCLMAVVAIITFSNRKRIPPETVYKETS